MGLLGDDDTQMAIAQGLLSGRGSLGLAAALANVRGVEDTRFKRSQQQMQMQQQQMQMEAARQAMMDEQRRREYIANLPDPQATANQQALAGGGGPTIANASRATVNPAIQALYQGVRAGAIPVGEYLKSFAPAELPMNKIDPKDFTPESLARFAQTRNYGDLQRLSELQFVEQGGGFLPVNKFTGQAAAAAIPKTGDPFKDLLLTGPNGGMVPNQPLINAKTGIAKAGAPTTSVKVENKMGEGVAAQVGPMLKDSLTAANSAVQTVDAAGRIIQAVDSGKLIAGPGADVRLKLAQLGTVLGVTGKSTQESIANTRQAIRGLAEMTLQGRKQMTGQGAITESESALAEKAMSGNVADLTAAEIRQLAQASDRAARFIYNQHNSMVQQLEGTEARGVAPFYKPAPLPTSPKLAPVTPMPAGVPGLRFIDFEGQ